MSEDPLIKHANEPIRPAATVIIVRDASPQYEIFMLRRTSQAAFAGGMYVFPGGRVDDEDHSRDYDAIHDGPADIQAAQKEALGENWRGYWLAGIRETFEESGLMLAYTSSGDFLSYNESNHDVYMTYRQQLHNGDKRLLEICQAEGLRLALDHIHFYNRWITPLGRPRRFDTRFFVAEVPPEQSGMHDGNETVDSIWISPSDALERNHRGEFGMMAVTQKQLADFDRFKTVEEYMAMVKTNREFPTYKPVLPPGE